MIVSALYQSAWISTGLPARAVTTQSPILASIQVSCAPGAPGIHEAVGKLAHLGVPGKIATRDLVIQLGFTPAWGSWGYGDLT